MRHALGNDTARRATTIFDFCHKETERCCVLPIILT